MTATACLAAVVAQLGNKSTPNCGILLERCTVVLYSRSMVSQSALNRNAFSR